MNTSQSISNSMQLALQAYFDHLMDSININRGLVGEYFGDSNDSLEARLLCQTRSIYFLVKYSELSANEEALSAALELYRKTKLHYCDATLWKEKPSSPDKTSDLYELAFIAYSFSYLYHATKDEEVAKDAKHVFSILGDMVQRDHFFPELTQYKGHVSQNPLMHLFEAFIAGYSIFTDETYKVTAVRLLEIVDAHFYDAKNHRITETLNPDPSFTWSEPGHAYEWASLLTLAASYGIENDSRIKINSLLSCAEKHGTNLGGFVASTYIDQQTEATHIYRIWPQLERIRAMFDLGQVDQGMDGVTQVLQHFFDEDGLPIEYLQNSESNQRIKSTTGYHVINSFESALKAVKDMGFASKEESNVHHQPQ
ncbi:MAG: AGE family epimerase/isomerase [Arenicella sp.]